MICVDTREATRETVAALCRRYPTPHVLDVGCGDGALLIALADDLERGLGIDVSRAAVEQARQRAGSFPHLSFRTLAAEELPDAAPGCFDVIVLAGSLEHMRDAGTALAAIRRCMHANSRMLVAAISPRAPHAVISRRWLRRSAQPVVAHLGVAGLLPVAKQAGLAMEDVIALYRGSRRGAAARAARPLLHAYDRLGGPTAAVVLRRAEP